MKRILEKTIFIGSTILSLKFLYSIATISHLKWLLAPTIPIVELFTGLQFNWVPGEGFVNSNFIIEKSCAGGNFFIICLALMLYHFMTYNLRPKSFLKFFLCVLGALVISWFANAFRIISAIHFVEFKQLIPAAGTESAHLYLGGFIYLSTLLLIHQFIIKNKAVSYEN